MNAYRCLDLFYLFEVDAYGGEHWLDFIDVTNAVTG